jgi:hypothetical protein
LGGLAPVASSDGCFVNLAGLVLEAAGAPSLTVPILPASKSVVKDVKVWGEGWKAVDQVRAVKTSCCVCAAVDFCVVWAARAMLQRSG